MKRLKSLLVWFLCLPAATPALAASGRYTIEPEKVAGAMAGIGMQVSTAQLTMLSAAVASTSEPQLQVESIQRWPGDKVVVRVECATREQCLPFFVGVRLGSAAPSQIAAANPAIGSEPSVRPRATMAVQAGTLATLYIEGDHIHIRVAVTCMQSGAVGQTVRAEGPDHQQTYTAQVAGPGVLKGRL